MKNAWMVRPYPSEDRMQEFLDQEIIAIGWAELGDMTGKTAEELDSELRAAYGWSGPKLGFPKAAFKILVNQMEIGDWILTPYGEDIHLAQVESGYLYQAADEAAGYPHQRRVKWLNCVSRDDLSEDLRNSLKARNTAANLTKHAEEIAALAQNQKPAKAAAPKQETLALTYPLRPDFSISLEIPKDMTKEESERLSTFIRTLYFTE